MDVGYGKGERRGAQGMDGQIDAHAGGGEWLLGLVGRHGAQRAPAALRLRGCFNGGAAAANGGGGAAGAAVIGIRPNGRCPWRERQHQQQSQCSRKSFDGRGAVHVPRLRPEAGGVKGLDF